MKTISVILTAFVMGIVLPVIAQETGEMPKLLPAKKNLIKVNLTSIILKDYTIQYERVLTKKTSLALAFAVAPNTALPFKQTLLNQFGDNDDARNIIESTKFQKYTATLEYRIYLSKKGAPAGFYLAPFARYSKMDMEQDFLFTPNDNHEHKAHMKGGFSGFGGGLLLGWQFPIGQHMTIDWWILGAFYGTKVKAEFIGTDPQMNHLNAQDRANLKEDIEAVEIPLYTTEATVGANEIRANLTGPYYGVRGLGICLAYRF